MSAAPVRAGWVYKLSYISITFVLVPTMSDKCTEVATLPYDAMASGTSQFENKPYSYHADPMTILLIGSTGNGKSTLGNFLLDPSEEHIAKENKTFEIASNNKPKTKEVEVGSKDGRLVVIDTPGLNEGDCEDLDHMIDIVEQLNKQRSISACILCVKFDTKMDTQYKATVKYYKRLLPRLFENNVLIVFTNYCTDERSKFNRERQNIDERAIVDNTRLEVSKDLKYKPACFQIDAFPFGSDERFHHESIRSSILDFISKQMKPVFVQDLKVAKTAAVMEIDRKAIEAAEGEISGYMNDVELANEKQNEIFKKFESDKSHQSSVELRLKKLNAELRELDSDELVTGEVWNLDQKWKFLKTQSEPFEVESEWPIAELDFWDNGKLKWTVTNRQERSISGEVKGKFMRGLYAKLTVKVCKRDKQTEEIEQLRKELSDKTEISGLLKEKLDDTKKAHDAYMTEIGKYEKYINDRQLTIEKRKEDSMTVEEAVEMLKKLRLLQ